MTGEGMILVKLGGSLITNKSKPMTLREEVLVDLVGQVKRTWGKTQGRLVLGHGQGSFGHVPAEKYHTIEGRVGEQSVYGAAVVEDVASQLNRIVVGECLKQGLPAVSIRPFDFARVNGKTELWLGNLLQALEEGFLPVVYGDVVLDETKSFTIWSTEKVLNELVGGLLLRGVEVNKVIHCGDVDGFLVKGKVVEEINAVNLVKMKKEITETQGFDVTGGMLHKVEESMLSAKQGVESYIIGGNHGGNLYKALTGGKFVGTRIRL